MAETGRSLLQASAPGRSSPSPGGSHGLVRAVGSAASRARTARGGAQLASASIAACCSMTRRMEAQPHVTRRYLSGVTAARAGHCPITLALHGLFLVPYARMAKLESSANDDHFLPFAAAVAAARGSSHPFVAGTPIPSTDRHEPCVTACSIDFGRQRTSTRQLLSTLGGESFQSRCARHARQFRTCHGL